MTICARKTSTMRLRTSAGGSFDETPADSGSDRPIQIAGVRALAGTRSSRHLLQRAQTDPPTRCWFSITTEPTTVRSATGTPPVQGIDDARFSDVTASLTRSISDSVVAKPLSLSFAAVSIGNTVNSSAFNRPTPSSSAESLPSRQYPASKRCYKRFSSLVSNSTIPSIPEQSASAAVKRDYLRENQSVPSSEEALHQNDVETGSYKSMKVLSRNVESPICTPARRFYSFASSDSPTWSTPPSTSHHALATRRIALREQRSSSASARHTVHVGSCCVDTTTDHSPRRITASASFASDTTAPLLAPSCGGLRYRVLEYLHCGRMDVALDGEQLCTNRIVYLVNLTSFNLPKRRRRACKCQQSRLHKLKELHDVELSKALPITAIFQRFERVNAYIATARSKGYQILLFDNDDESSHAMALQYIMLYYRTSFVYACTHLERHYGGQIRLSSFISQVLEAWEEKCKGTSNALESA